MIQYVYCLQILMAKMSYISFLFFGIFEDFQLHILLCINAQSVNSFLMYFKLYPLTAHWNAESTTFFAIGKSNLSSYFKTASSSSSTLPIRRHINRNMMT